MAVKILVISSFDNNPGFNPEAELLIELHKFGAQIDIMTDRWTKYIYKFHEAGMKILDYQPGKIIDFNTIRNLRKILTDGKYNILQLNNNLSIFNGVIAAWNLPLKVLFLNGITDIRQKPFYILKYISSLVNNIICINETLSDHIKTKSNMLNPKRMVSIQKGVNLKWYQDIEPADLNKLGIPGNSFVVSCYIHDGSASRIQYLIKALNYLPHHLPIHIIIVGNNLLNRKNYSILIKSKNLDKIHILGLRSDLLNIIAASNAFVLPLKQGEKVPMSLLEAMSMGIAPVITKARGINNLVMNNQNGLVIQQNNPQAIATALIKMYFNPDLTFEMGLEARRFIARHYNIYQSVIQYKQLYEDLYASTLSQVSYYFTKKQLAFQ